MKKFSPLFYLSLLFLFAGQSFGQINFTFSANDSALKLNKTYLLNVQDSFKLSKLKFYVSNIKLIGINDDTVKLYKKHFLIDLESPESLIIKDPELDSKKFKQIIFNLGVDSITNTLGAQSGCLDPMNGMYWAWQSGYINFKLEGNSNICPARKNKFQFHLGGFLAPFNSAKKIDFTFPPNQKVNIEFNVSEFLIKSNLKSNYQIMSPSKMSLNIVEIASNNFSLKK